MVRALSIGIMLLFVVLPLVAGSGVLLLPPSFDKAMAGLQLNSWLQSTLITLGFSALVTLTVCYLSLWWGRRIVQSSSLAKMAPILGMPHAALAVGLLLLLSPSGWLVRLIHQFFDVFPSPPSAWWVADKSLLTLTLVLVIKEIPFMLMMIAAQRDQLPLQRWLMHAQSMGYSARRGWWVLIVPALLPRLILPLFAVTIYTVAVVDIALIAGPNTPPLLAPRVHEASLRFSEIAQVEAWLGLWVLVLVSAFMLVLVVGHQKLYQRLCGYALGQPKPTRGGQPKRVSYGLSGLLVLSASAMILLGLQSVAGTWFYPDLTPSSWNLTRWVNEWPYAWPLTKNSLVLALSSAVVGMFAAILVLEQQRRNQQLRLAWWPLMLLFVPQLTLVLGWQRLVGQDAGWGWLLWSHSVFTFPYAYLVLHGAYVHFPMRWLSQAQSLGHSPWRAWWLVLFPQLRNSFALGLAVAMAVSISQYLPTLWLAGASYPTLTTETVSVAAGGDWRLASIYALLQTVIPVVALIWAGWLVSKPRWKNKDARN